MYEITFLPSKLKAPAQEGDTILKAARRAGLVIESPCNGNGTCGKCKVRLPAACLKNIEHGGLHQLSGKEKAKGFVLACGAKVHGDITVEIQCQQKNKTLKILSHGQSFELERDTYIQKHYDKESDVTAVLAGSEQIAAEPGDTVADSYGIVVDIGTTTLVTSLVCLADGKELASDSALNPQAVYAQDVLSRINFAAGEGGLNTLFTELIREINRMIGTVTEEAGVRNAHIYEVIFSGNTCMLHLAAGVSPCSLGRFPYTPQLVGGTHLKAADLGLHISDKGLVYLPPIISAYVGADITSGILAAQLHEREDRTLFVDIGTNGEMAVSVGGKLSATSTAAGPAFEGMNITFGMRAGLGAIEVFHIDSDGSLIVKTIGNIPAVGICGSGLLDIVGALVDRGVINKSGKYVDAESSELPPSLRERLVKIDGKPVFLVSDHVYLTQKDVRQVQLAKGAVRAGIEFLLKSKGLTPSEIDRVLIAGSFGYHLRAGSLINIGLLPEEFEGKIEMIGNTSKSGGQAFLLNQTYREQMQRLVGTVEVIELSGYQDFDKVFVKCLGF